MLTSRGAVARISKRAFNSAKRTNAFLCTTALPRVSLPSVNKYSSVARPSSNSPCPPRVAQMNVEQSAATQPPRVKLEVNPEDPLAPFNDKINKEIIAKLDPQHTAHDILYFIIDIVSGYKKDFLDESYARYAACNSLFEKYEELPNMILDAWKEEDFKLIRTLRILQKKPTDEDTSMGGTLDNISATAQTFMVALEGAWNGNFIGPGASILWDHIKNNQYRYYANYVEILQSSGMGKSRMIDELSKTRLTIPLCLRSGCMIGYPYADDEVRDFLMTPQNEREALLHVVAFLRALFEHTEATLRSEFHTKTEYSDVAALFRQYMVSSQYPSLRRTFFHTVVANAKKYVSESSPSSPSGFTVASFLLEEEMMIDRVHSACTSLVSLLETKYPSSNEEPILLIAWDDANALANKVNTHSSWSHFITLRRVLRELNHHPISSIFSSTRILDAPGPDDEMW